MSEMIERVASALEPKCRAFGPGDTPMLVARELARAAIEAMRQPTKHMVDAAYAAYDRFEEASEGAWCGLSSAYQAMIGAALCVSDENRNGSDPEGLRSEGLPARCHEVTDALTLSPKEQKGD